MRHDTHSTTGPKINHEHRARVRHAKRQQARGEWEPEEDDPPRDSLQEFISGCAMIFIGCAIAIMIALSDGWLSSLVGGK